MGQRRHARAERTGGPRENPLASGIVRHNSHMRKSRGRPRWESSSLTTTYPNNCFATMQTPDHKDCIDDVHNDSESVEHDDYSLDGPTHFPEKFPSTSDVKKADNIQYTDDMFTEDPNKLVDRLKYLLDRQQRGDYSTMKEVVSIVNHIQDGVGLPNKMAALQFLLLCQMQLPQTHHIPTTNAHYSLRAYWVVKRWLMGQEDSCCPAIGMLTLMAVRHLTFSLTRPYARLHKRTRCRLSVWERLLRDVFMRGILSPRYGERTAARSPPSTAATGRTHTVRAQSSTHQQGPSYNGLILAADAVCSADRRCLRATANANLEEHSSIDALQWQPSSSHPEGPGFEYQFDHLDFNFSWFPESLQTRSYDRSTKRSIHNLYKQENIPASRCSNCLVTHGAMWAVTPDLSIFEADGLLVHWPLGRHDLHTQVEAARATTQIPLPSSKVIYSKCLLHPTPWSSGSVPFRGTKCKGGTLALLPGVGWGGGRAGIWGSNLRGRERRACSLVAAPGSSPALNAGDVMVNPVFRQPSTPGDIFNSLDTKACVIFTFRRRFQTYCPHWFPCYYRSRRVLRIDDDYRKYSKYISYLAHH
ncbi:hypothetical protein PR048_015968 [Dryococelus australis]|uniref:Uncharacterized protein n=1 Tax=Dryococelus australis TaxID=614101 RepID=A0ABQ9HIE8_9NEOP|nr:hypothetical protein PR048_015968 [Dryococelus australis]